MGKAFLCKSNGGGGGGLTFRVLGNPAPTSPKPNDIWVDTDEKITSYIFSATEPEGYAEGMVWISTGTSSPTEFNALKKNGIQVYPTSAKQHVDGAWVDVTAKSYQNGAWVDWWDGELYKDGDEYDNYTGGWIKGEIYGNATMTKNADSIQLSTSSGSRVHVETSEKVEFGKYKTLTIVFDVINSASNTNVVRLGYSTNKATNLANATTMKEYLPGKGATGEHKFSLSLDGAPESAYVVVGVGVTGTVINLKKVQMTK